MSYFREELYCSAASLPWQQIRLQGRTLFPNQEFRGVENKGLTPSLGKDFIVREQIEHAIRHHLDINFDVDPELYASFAEAIEDILKEFKDNWKVIRQKLEELRQKIANAEKEENTYGLHRRKQMPFFRIFKKEIFDGQELNDDQAGQLIDLTKQTTDLLETELQLKGFWDNIPARNKLRASLQELLLSRAFFNLPNMIKKRSEIISRVMETAERNNDTIILREGVL